MTKESATSVWEQIQITKSSDFRNPVFLENDTVSVDSKNVYIGNSQWVIKAKKLNEIKILHGDESKPSSIVLTMATDEFRVTLSHIHEQGWVKFYKRLEKFVNHSPTTLQSPLSAKQQQQQQQSASKKPMNKTGRYKNNGKTASGAFFESTGKARFSPARPSKRPLQQQQEQQRNYTDNDNNIMMSPMLPTTRKGRVFGRKAATNRLASPTAQIPWDEDDYVLKKPMKDSSTLDAAAAAAATNNDDQDDDDQVMVESDNEINDTDEQVLVATDDDSDDEEVLFDVAPSGKGKHSFVDDSDDEEDHGDDTKNYSEGSIKRTKTVASPTRTATTPVRNHPKVSPASRTQTKLNGEVTKGTGKTGQKGISSFFAPRQQAAKTTSTTVTASSFDPSKRIATTPVRPSTALKPRAWLEQSNAGLSSPSKKRKQDLFGTAAGFRTPPRKESEDDPIEEFSSPPRTTNAAMDALDRADHDPRQQRLEFMAPMTTGNSYKKRARIPAMTPPRRLDLEACSAKTGSNASELETAFVPKNPWRGLRNHGNTCYLNASVQMLATLACTTGGRLNWWDKLRGSGGPLTGSLLDVTDQLRLAPRPGSTIVSPRHVKSAMDAITNKFIGYEQRDAHEFLSDLIDSVHEELNPPKDKLNEVVEKDGNTEACSEVNSPTNDSKVVRGDAATIANPANPADSDELLSTKGSVKNETSPAFPTDDFRMTVEVCLKCESCGYSRTKTEMYRHLSLDIISDNSNDKVHIPVSLHHFFQPEIREIRCEKCTEGTHASQSQRIVSCPKYLLLHLKRFIFVERPIPTGNENAPPNSPSSRPPVEYIFKKNKAPVEIAEELSLDPFCVDPAAQGYKLRSLVYHMGAKPSSGHYTADAVRPYREGPQTESVSDNTANPSSFELTNATTDEATNTNSPPEEEWITFDDGNTAKTSLSKIQSSSWRPGAAYMLLYSLD